MTEAVPKGTNASAVLYPGDEAEGSGEPYASGPGPYDLPGIFL
jgi:hypothetical protein